MWWIESQRDVQELVRRVGPRPLHVDLEFSSATRLAPRLCVVQLAWVEDRESVATALVDAQSVDAAPVVSLLGDGRPVVMHAAKQDLAILRDSFGLRTCNLFDTQIAAALVSSQEQIGYARLVEDIAHQTIDKSQQWTDWERRPLSAKQLAYAEADVVHLPQLAATLAQRLSAKKRVSWCAEECTEFVQNVLTAQPVDLARAWEDIAPAGLSPDVRGALQALAAWRLQTARAEDRPLGHIAKTEVLVELARRRPKRAAELASLAKGIDDRWHDEIFAALARATPLVDTRGAPRQLHPAEQAWVEILYAYATAVATVSDIAPRVLAARADIEQLVRAERADSGDRGRLALGWRREFTGDAMREFIRGTRTLRATPSGVELDRSHSD